MTADGQCTRFSLLIQRVGAGSISFETDRPEQIITYVTHYISTDNHANLSVEVGDLSALVGRTLAEVERALIVATMRRLQCNRVHAALVLGISVQTLGQRLKDCSECRSV